MATCTTLCGPCSERHITKTSEYWCSECEEAICDDCQEHHKVFKATRSHELIPIDKYKSLPAFITDIQHSCTYHNEKYQHYCVAHALPICFKCIKEHYKCNVIPLEEVTFNAKTSVLFQDLESRLLDLLQNIDRIKKDRNANLISIKEKKGRYITEIHQIRTKINEHFNKLENEIIQDLEEKECQCTTSIQKILSSVKEKENLIKENQTNLQSIKQHASDLQAFLGMTNIELQILENEKYLQSLIETKQTEQVDLVFKVDPGVISILKSSTNFGSNEIKTKTSSNIWFFTAKDKQMQLRVTPERTINDPKFILQGEITTDGGAIRGCYMSVEGEYFFTNHTSHKLYVISSEGTFKYNIMLAPGHGFDITFIDEKTMAITSGASSDMGIVIIDTESRTKIKFISLPSRSYGIACDQDSLYVSVQGCGIYKVNTIDYTTSHVTSCKLAGFSYVSAFDNMIYYTDCIDDSVICCDSKGSRVWNFKDTSVLKCPRGITVDNYGNVFVVGEASSNVVLISNDGKHNRQILTEKDGLRKPSAIFFEKQTSKLLVANEGNNAFLYSVT